MTELLLPAAPPSMSNPAAPPAALPLQTRRIKCVILGCSQCGKTSLLMTYTSNGGFPTDYVPVVMDSIEKNIFVDGTPTLLTLWDTVGHNSEASRLRPLMYPLTDVFVLCIDVMSPSSLATAREIFLAELQRYVLAKPSIMVLGCKIDLRDDEDAIERLKGAGQEPINRAQGTAFASEIGAFGYLECSALNQKGVAPAIDEAVRHVLRQPKPGPKTPLAARLRSAACVGCCAVA